MCILGDVIPQNWFDPGVGKYCIIPLYLGLANNNCAPSFLRSLCGIGGDCFGLSYMYFSEGAQLLKTNSHNDRNKDGAKLLFGYNTFFGAVTIRPIF